MNAVVGPEGPQLSNDNNAVFRLTQPDTLMEYQEVTPLLANRSGRPIRVQLRRTKGWRMPPNTVKVDRTTRQGNPFVCHRKDDPDRAECKLPMGGDPLVGGYCCLRTFNEWIGSAREGRSSYTGSIMAGLDGCDGYPVRNAYYAAIADLRGKNLGCWCRLCPAHSDGKPFGTDCADCAPCHSDMLGELANPTLPALDRRKGGAS